LNLYLWRFRVQLSLPTSFVACRSVHKCFQSYLGFALSISIVCPNMSSWSYCPNMSSWLYQSVCIAVCMYVWMSMCTLYVYKNYAQIIIYYAISFVVCLNSFLFDSPFLPVCVFVPVCVCIYVQYIYLFVCIYVCRPTYQCDCLPKLFVWWPLCVFLSVFLSASIVLSLCVFVYVPVFLYVSFVCLWPCVCIHNYTCACGCVCIRNVCL